MSSRSPPRGYGTKEQNRRPSGVLLSTPDVPRVSWPARDCVALCCLAHAAARLLAPPNTTLPTTQITEIKSRTCTTRTLSVSHALPIRAATQGP